MEVLAVEIESTKKVENPFKFLEAYSRDENRLFEGRNNEIEQLYELLFSKNVVLVYGESGVGKTSLIQCGLANRFSSTDWYDVWVLRKGNIKTSVRDALIEHTGEPADTPVENIKDLVHSLYLKYFKPVYIIIDQLEDLFINGAHEERKEFFAMIEQIMLGKLPCKIILVIQERFHSRLQECENWGIPVYRAAIQIDRMTMENARRAVLANLEGKEIKVPGDDYEAISWQIVQSCTDERGTVHLPDVQVLLYMLWEKALEQQNGELPVEFTPELIKQVADTDNIVRKYLTEAVVEVAGGNEGRVWLFLQEFISDKETRIALKKDAITIMDQQDVKKFINHFVHKKILKVVDTNSLPGEDEKRYRLAHDSLLPLIRAYRGRMARPRLTDPPLKGKGNPYKGLIAYDEDDANRFFGRTRVVNELLKRVHEEKLLAIVGASGTGKSSLIKAGILPELRKMGYLIITEKPTDNPVRTLENITRVFEENKGHKKFVLYIDQFEELSSRCEDGEQREEFISFIRNLLERNGNNHEPVDVKVLLSVRADYEFEFDKSLRDWRSSKFIVPPFLEEEVREIIVEPAYNAGLEYHPFYLVDIIVKDVMQSNGSLPLLSYTLSQMYWEYEASERNDGWLTEADYNKIGGVVDGLRTRANEIYASADEAKKRTICNVMLRMVSLGIGDKAGKRVLENELEYSQPDENVRVKEVITQFVEKWLVVTGKDELGRTYYEPAHDSLVRAWDLISDLIRIYGKELLYLQRNLSEAVADYKEYGKLWHEDPRLDTLKKILDSPDNWLNKEETEFVTNSFNRRQELLELANREEQEKLKRTRELADALAAQLQEQELKEEYLSEKLEAQEQKEKMIRESKRRMTVWLVLLVILLGLASYFGIEARSKERLATENSQLAITERNKAKAATIEVQREKHIADSLKVLAEQHSVRMEEVSLVARAAAEKAKLNEAKAVREESRAKKIAEENRKIAEENKRIAEENKSNLKKSEESRLLIEAQHKQLLRAEQAKAEFGLLRERSGKRIKKIQQIRESDPALAYRIAEMAAREDTANKELQILFSQLKKSNSYFEAFVKDGVTSSFFSNDGKSLITLSGTSVIDIWNMKGKRAGGFTSSGNIKSVQQSPSGKQIMTVSDNKVQLHDMTGKLLNSFVLSGAVEVAVYAGNEKIVIVKPQGIEAYSISGKNLFITSNRKAENVLDVQADEDFILVKYADRVDFYDQEKKKWLKSLYNKENYLLPGGKGVLSFEPPGAGVGYYKIKILDNKGNVKRGDKESYPIENLSQPYKIISWLSFSKDARTCLLRLSPEYKQQQQQQQQKQSDKSYSMSDNYIPSVFYLLNRDEKTLKPVGGSIQNMRELVLSSDGNYFITGESRRVSIYNSKSAPLSSFGRSDVFAKWGFHPFDNNIILTQDRNTLLPGQRVKLWVKGTPQALDADGSLKVFTEDELRQADIE